VSRRLKMRVLIKKNEDGKYTTLIGDLDVSQYVSGFSVDARVDKSPQVYLILTPDCVDIDLEDIELRSISYTKLKKIEGHGDPDIVL